MSDKLSIPRRGYISGTDIELPYMFVADEAFPLRENLMKPFPHRQLATEKEIFNYRLSRARNSVECSFGSLAQMWRILFRQIDEQPMAATNIVKAITVLYNFVLVNEPHRFIVLEAPVPNEHLLSETTDLTKSSKAQAKINKMWHASSRKARKLLYDRRGCSLAIQYFLNNKASILAVFIVCLWRGVSSAVSGGDWPIGDLRWCMQELPTEKFGILPGLGWDNLRNIEMGQVIAYDYNTCRLTDDNKYLVPDDIYAIPIKSSKIQSFAEIISDWKTASSVTANTVNSHPAMTAYGYSISGEFSKERENMKSKQIESSTSTVRMQLRYDRYEVKVQPGARINTAFKNRLLSIAAELEKNNTVEAQYQCQLMVRDFGTHVLTSVTAGGGLLKDDYISRSYLNKHGDDKNSILAAASSSFQLAYQVSLSNTDTQRKDNTSDKGYSSNITHSYTETYGGQVFLAGSMTAHEWAENLDSNLVAIDRDGDPLYFLVTSSNLPELPKTTVGLLERELRSAVELYYQMNVIPGCTDMTSPQFSLSANLDDGSCGAKAAPGLSLGGIYQTCKTEGDVVKRDPCSGLRQKNALTGEMSCPKGFTKVLLHDGKYKGAPEYKSECKRCMVVSKCCEKEQFTATAHFQTYWCAGKIDDLAGPLTSPASGTRLDYSTNRLTTENEKLASDLGYVFGGVYTSSTDNLVTGVKACPAGFYHRDILTGLKICISDDYEKDMVLSVPFGGFFSCSKGNLLAVNADLDLDGDTDDPLERFIKEQQLTATENSWPKKCPTGYSQHLATIENNCAIYYCVESGRLNGPILPKVKRPPYINKPYAVMEEEEISVTADESLSQTSDSATEIPDASGLNFQNPDSVYIAPTATVPDENNNYKGAEIVTKYTEVETDDQDQPSLLKAQAKADEGDGKENITLSPANLTVLLLGTVLAVLCIAVILLVVQRRLYLQKESTRSNGQAATGATFKESVENELGENNTAFNQSV